VVGCSRESSVEDTYSVWIQKAVYMYTSVDGWLPVLEILLLLVLGYRRECSVEGVVACCWGYFFCLDKGEKAVWRRCYRCVTFLLRIPFPSLQSSIFNREMLFFARGRSQSLLTRPKKF